MMLRLATWLAVATACLPTAVAAAGCFPIAELDRALDAERAWGGEPRLLPAAFAPVTLPGGATVRLTFLGHASFHLETRAGVTAITDYNGHNRAATAPTIVTMNNAHSTHFTDVVEPGVEHVLRGWVPGGGLARHDVSVDDLRVRNVPTSVRGRAGAESNSNSIFVFEAEDLCIAHLGHLHHRLEDDHLGELGIIDVLLVPADGMWTLPHRTAAEVVEQIRPSVVIPMHYFASSVLEQFLAELDDDWEVVSQSSPTVTFSRLDLPYRQVIILAGS